MEGISDSKQGKQVWLIRHGTNKRPGNSDPNPPLTREGVREVRLMGDWLGANALPRPVVVVASPLRRSLQTANILTGKLRFSGGGPVLRVASSRMVRSGGDLVELFILASQMDKPESAGMKRIAGQPVGSLVFIGHAQNNLLEMLEFLLDPREVFARISGKDATGLSVEEVVEACLADERISTSVGNGEFAFPKSRAAGYRLLADSWSGILKPGSAEIIQSRSFSAPSL